jgi:hypothetical protein
LINAKIYAVSPVTCLALLCAFTISACVSIRVETGEYNITAYDKQGTKLRQIALVTNRTADIYSVRNALCSAFSQATIVIKNPSGDDFEPPYKCKDAR